MTENLAARGEGLAGLVVPPIWRIERCTKHEDYVPDCCLCNEEILTIKTEKAYRAGFKAALEAAAPAAPAPRDKMACWMAARDWCANWTVSMAAVDSLAELLMEFQAALATPSPQAPAHAENCNSVLFNGPMGKCDCREPSVGYSEDSPFSVNRAALAKAQVSANIVAPNPDCPLCFGTGSWVEGERCACTKRPLR